MQINTFVQIDTFFIDVINFNNFERNFEFKQI